MSELRCSTEVTSDLARCCFGEVVGEDLMGVGSRERKKEKIWRH